MQATTKTTTTRTIIICTRIVFMCIFALTHHLPTISASASDLSLSTISSSASSPSSSSSSSSSLSAGPTVTDIVTAKSSDASTKTMDLFAIENDVAAKEISMAETSSSSAVSTTLTVQPNLASLPSSSSSSSQSHKHQQELTTRRQTRSLFYAYPYGAGLYGSLYTGYGVGGAYYYPSTSYAYSYAYYPSVHKFWGVYNPYYGYPRVIYG